MNILEQDSNKLKLFHMICVKTYVENRTLNFYQKDVPTQS